MTDNAKAASRPRLLGLAGAVAAASLLASCAMAPTTETTSNTRSSNNGRVQFSSRDYGVPASPRVVADGQRIPRGGGRDLVGKPYRVAGKTYVPREDPNYVATGLASWYGANFHGRLTANGEVYDIGGITAAHPTMPLPSYARVTNLDTGAAITVRVNDRGPFHRGRVIDVSERAAELLGMRRSGVANVRVQYVSRAPLEGHDERVLMASYQPPGRGDVPSTAFAFNERREDTGRFAVASAEPSPRARPAALRGTLRDRPTQVAALAAPAGKPSNYNPFAARDIDALFEVEPASLSGGDPLADLLHENLPARSYAPAPTLTPAQLAIEDFAAARFRPTIPANAETATVQVGVFGDKANADRIAGHLGSLGTVSLSAVSVRSKEVWSVSVRVGGTTSVDAVIAAAAEAGATGAYRLR